MQVGINIPYLCHALNFMKSPHMVVLHRCADDPGTVLPYANGTQESAIRRNMDTQVSLLWLDVITSQIRIIYVSVEFLTHRSEFDTNTAYNSDLFLCFTNRFASYPQL